VKSILYLVLVEHMVSLSFEKVRETCVETIYIFNLWISYAAS